jgi:hypothetical protein
VAQDPLAPTTTSRGATAAYAPPEWLKGNGSRNVAGEVYCLASTAYHLITRHVPYPNARTIVDQFLLKEKGPPTCPSLTRADVPTELDGLLVQALSPWPKDRPQSMSEFASELQKIKANIDSRDTPTSPGEPELIYSVDHQKASLAFESGLAWRPQLYRHLVQFLGFIGVALALCWGAAWLLENPKRQLIASQDVTLAIGAYLAVQKDSDAAACRFLLLDHRHNDPDVPSQELTEVRQAVRELLGHLAGHTFEVLELPQMQSTVLVLDLRRIRWKSGHWDLLLDHYPYGVYHGKMPPDITLNEVTQRVHKRTSTMVPAVRADWFLAAVTSTPLGPIYAKVAGRDPATSWPASPRRVSDRYREQTLTLDQMAREIGADSRQLRAAIEAGEVGEIETFQRVLIGGVLPRSIWEGRKEDVSPPFFAAVEACKTGEAIRPPPQ